MKKNWILSLTLAAALCGSSNATFAQSNVEVASLSAEVLQQVEAINQKFQTAPQEAEKDFNSLVKKTKDEETLTSIGRYFYNKGMYDEALDCANRVYKIKPKHIGGLLLAGDALVFKKMYGEAGSKFEEAKNYDENCSDAYFGLAHVYKEINPNVAKEVLSELKAKQPNNPKLNKELAMIHFKLNEVPEAIAAYDKYFQINSNPEIDCLEEYAILQFLNKNYEGSLAYVEKGIQKDPKRISFARMKFYNYVFEEKFAEAKPAADAFFGKFVDSLYNENDYKYLGDMNTRLKDYDGAISAYEYVLKKNPGNSAILKDLSDAYERMGNFDKAIQTFKDFLSKTGNESLSEKINLGKIYYTAAQKSEDKTTKMSYIAQGDTIFGEVASKNDSYLGPIWRARINVVQDMENPVEAAKVQFEETLKRLEGKSEDYNGARKECYLYLAIYNFKKDNFAQAKIYSQKVAEIDPNNGTAKAIIGACK